MKIIRILLLKNIHDKINLNLFSIKKIFRNKKTLKLKMKQIILI